MAKPICFIKIPNGYFHMNYNLNDYQGAFEEKLSDYHVLVFPTDEREVDFKVWYKKDFEDVKYEELKAIINDHLNQTKQI